MCFCSLSENYFEVSSDLKVIISKNCLIILYNNADDFPANKMESQYEIARACDSS